MTEQQWCVMSNSKTQAKILMLDRYRMRRLVDGNFYDTLQATPGVSLVVFTSLGCASCRAWKEVLKEYLSINTDIVIYEVDAHESMALANEYEIFHLPALFLFKEGAYHCELNCEANLDKIHQAITRLLQGPAEEEP